ncbi:zinc-ribbon domain-containing protein [Hyphomicrobium sp.]|uniref:zinc-ribbon domain-containing protein n=1 Tax=Hyphomicrobium sp. TaxID=82 RepID=UPI001D66205A|nr:zinc-ribbon domain-containing protein [Hyphomicrobium sp.]
MGSHFLSRLLGGFGGGSRHGRRGHGDRGDYGYGSPSGQRTAAFQRVVVCPSCRADNAPDSRFCAQCGQSLGSVEQACAKCGVTLPPGTKFCPSCGTSVTSGGAGAA